jgi:hypothetical protein
MSFILVNTNGNYIVDSPNDSSSQVYLDAGNYTLRRYSIDGAVLPSIACTAFFPGNYQVYNSCIELIPSTRYYGEVELTSYIDTLTNLYITTTASTATALAPGAYRLGVDSGWTSEAVGPHDKLIESIEALRSLTIKYDALKKDYDFLVNNLFEKT